MSNVTPIYKGGMLVPSTQASVWPWIIVIIILILVIIALAIWLAVRHTSDNNSGTGRLVPLQGAEITASSSVITGAWGTLANEEDKVTLYVSTDPIKINSDGTVSNTTIKPASATGSNNSVTISAGLTINKMYNAVLVATGDNTNHYSVFGPQKVFTQETKQVEDWVFNIEDLDNPLGAISETATYTETTADIGIYGFETKNSYIVRYEDDTEITDPERILCRANGSTNTNIILAEVAEDGKIYPEGTEQNQVNHIPKSNCQWNYNDQPPNGAEGRNQWCLQSLQSTTTTSSFKEPLCLSRNGSALDARTPANATRWYNKRVANKPTQ